MNPCRTACLDQQVALVVITSHDTYRLRQAFEPFRKALSLIEPEVVDILEYIFEECPAEPVFFHFFSESLASLV